MKTIRRMLALCALAFSIIGLHPASADNLSPDQLVKVTADKVLSEVQNNRKALEDDTSKIYDLVNKFILPHFDFEKMSRSVLGKHWNSASPEEQKGFIKQFQMLLVRTYAVALLNYSNQAIEYLPFRLNDGANVAVVKTKVSDGNSPPLPIDYLLHNAEQWKVVDVKIDGISLVSNYRTSFAQQIRQGGVGGLVKQLAARNNYLEQSASGASTEATANNGTAPATEPPAEPEPKAEVVKPNKPEPQVVDKPVPQAVEKKVDTTAEKPVAVAANKKDEPKTKTTDKPEKMPAVTKVEEKKPTTEKKDKKTEAPKVAEKAGAAAEATKAAPEAGTKTAAKEAETKATEAAAEAPPPPPPTTPKKRGFIDL